MKNRNEKFVTVQRDHVQCHFIFILKKKNSRWNSYCASVFSWDQFQVSPPLTPIQSIIKISCHLQNNPNDESIKLQFTGGLGEDLKQESHHIDVCIQSREICSVALHIFASSKHRLATAPDTTCHKFTL